MHHQSISSWRTALLVRSENNTQITSTAHRVCCCKATSLRFNSSSLGHAIHPKRSIGAYKLSVPASANDTSNAPSSDDGASSDVGVTGTVILAGFYLEELAAIRILIDQFGGYGIKVVVPTPAMLHEPLGKVLSEPEPEWDQNMPEDWVHGQGWGQQRTLLLHEFGPYTEFVMQLIASTEMGSMNYVLSSKYPNSKLLGEFLAESEPIPAFKLDAEPELEFQDDLPSLEKLMQDELEAKRKRFEVERVQKASTVRDTEEVPLDIIDQIASNSGMNGAKEVNLSNSRSADNPEPPSNGNIRHSSNSSMSGGKTSTEEEVINPDVMPQNDEGDNVTIPDVDSFILNKSGLEEVLKGSNVELEDVLKMLKSKGINLPE